MEVDGIDGQMISRKPFKWDARKEEAAILLAEREMSAARIADRVGVTPATISHWNAHPQFRAKVAARAKELAAAVMEFAISKRYRRVEALDQVRSGLLRVVEERAGHAEANPDPDMSGGETGLVVRRERTTGAGAGAVTTVEYEVDTGLIKALRDVQMAAAQELGQWQERAKIEVDAGVTREYVVLGPEDSRPPDPAVDADYRELGPGEGVAGAT